MTASSVSANFGVHGVESAFGGLMVEGVEASDLFPAIYSSILCITISFLMLFATFRGGVRWAFFMYISFRGGFVYSSLTASTSDIDELLGSREKTV